MPALVQLDSVEARPPRGQLLRLTHRSLNGWLFAVFGLDWTPSNVTTTDVSVLLSTVLTPRHCNVDGQTILLGEVAESRHCSAGRMSASVVPASACEEVTSDRSVRLHLSWI